MYKLNIVENKLQHHGLIPVELTSVEIAAVDSDVADDIIYPCLALATRSDYNQSKFILFNGAVLEAGKKLCIGTAISPEDNYRDAYLIAIIATATIQASAPDLLVYPVYGRNSGADTVSTVAPSNPMDEYDTLPHQISHSNMYNTVAERATSIINLSCIHDVINMNADKTIGSINYQYSHIAGIVVENNSADNISLKARLEVQAYKYIDAITLTTPYGA